MTQVEDLLDQLNEPSTKLGDIRKLAKTIKKDHDLAMALWETNVYLARQLAILIMDKNQLTQELINQLTTDMATHNIDERNQLVDWLMANQLTKSKKTIALMETWLDSSSSLQRRIFWYYQGRLRWMGQTPPANTEALLTVIEAQIEKEVPEVQWAMNFTAAQIGIFQEEYRLRCVQLGERIGLYKDEKVAKNCTPNYLPLYIATQVEKISK